MARVLVYSKVPCPFCVAAFRLLEEKGVDFEKRDLTGQFEAMQELKERTGWQTFPMIFINDELVGGYTDLRELEEKGELDQLLGLSSPKN